jgi:hypothetical protein
MLTNLKTLEDSLKRLQQKKTNKKAEDGLSDEDKIRLQLYLDVVEFGQQVSFARTLFNMIFMYIPIYSHRYFLHLQLFKTVRNVNNGCPD